MEARDPQLPQLAEQVGKLDLIEQSPLLDYWADYYDDKLHRVQHNPRENPANIAELMCKFSVANSALLAAKAAEKELEAAFEELLD